MTKPYCVCNHKVHLFGLDGVTHCSHELNNMLFNKNLNLDSLINTLHKESIQHKTFLKKIEKSYKSILRDKKFQRKIIVTLALALFISLNPSSTFALSYMDKITSTGRALIPVVVTGINKGILIITALRLFSEYMNGFNKYSVTEICKDCITVILATTIIPNLPAIFEIIF